MSVPNPQFYAVSPRSVECLVQMLLSQLDWPDQGTLKSTK